MAKTPEAHNKAQERAELHKTLWRIANDLRGSVDGWDFKTYVLGMLFYRFISENLSGYLNQQERRAGSAAFDYAQLSDVEAEFGRLETVQEKGFYILPSELFANVRARARHDANLNETLSRIFAGSASEHDIKGLFDDLDVNSSKLGPTVAKRDNATLFIDGSSLFVRSGNKNKSTPHFARLVDIQALNAKIAGIVADLEGGQA